MSIEEILCSQRPIESCRYNYSCNEVLFHLPPFRNPRRITSLPKMMEVLLFASIIFGMCCSLLAVLKQFVLHKCIPIRTLILEVFLEVRRESLFYISFVQIFLERLKTIAIFFMTQSLNSYSLSSGELKCHFTSAHNISFSVSGTMSASISVALLFFHSLKLMGMWSLT